MNELLFVYGTLRRGGGHDVEEMVSDARFVTGAEFQGGMYLVDYFPGVKDSADSEARVRGEVYELGADGQSLRILDEFEDFRPEDPPAGVYLREMRNVRLDSGEFRKVWIYIYNGSVTNLRKIDSGDFVRFLKESSAGFME